VVGFWDVDFTTVDDFGDGLREVEVAIFFTHEAGPVRLKTYIES